MPTRCIVFNLKPLRDDVITDYLIKTYKIPDYEAKVCASFAQGRLGKAIRLLESEDFNGVKEAAVRLVKNIYSYEIYDLIEEVKMISQNKVNINDFIDILEMWYRDVILFKVTKDPNNLIFKDEINYFRKSASKSSYEGLENIINGCEIAKSRIKANVNFDLAIDILGADHHGYIARMMAALTALGVDASRLKMVIMQMVRLVKNGETYKLSKRSGKAVTLETLLDEVPIDAARYVFNSKEPNTHLEFDLDLAVEQSSQNPVYYVQYAHARICSILRNLEAEGIAPAALSAESLDCLDSTEEREVIRHLSALPQTIINAAEGFDPALITRYAYDLATLFHRFYNSCRVKGEEENIMQARLNLCLAVKTAIANVLKLLKIDAPSEM